MPQLAQSDAGMPAQGSLLQTLTRYRRTVAMTAAGTLLILSADSRTANAADVLELLSGAKVEGAVKTTLASLNIPTRSEINLLARRVEELSRKIDSLKRR